MWNHAEKSRKTAFVALPGLTPPWSALNDNASHGPSLGAKFIALRAESPARKIYWPEDPQLTNFDLLIQQAKVNVLRLPEVEGVRLRYAESAELKRTAFCI